MTLPPVKIRIVGVLALAAALIWWFWPADNDSNKLTLYGNVDIREVDLGFRVSGRLLTMQFEEGDTVTAGVLLATVDDKPYRDGVLAADARVRQAQAQLARLRAGSRPQEIRQAIARLQEITAALKNANQNLLRQQELNEEGVSSQRAMDAAVASRDQVAAQAASSQEALALAKEGPRSEDIVAAEAALAATQAELAQRQTQLDDTVLLSPNRGVILTRAKEPGAIVGAAEPVYILSLQDTVYIRAYVAEAQLGQVVPGTRVSVSTDGSDKRYQGQVGFVSPRAEFTPRTVETPELRTDLVYRLRIVMTKSDEALRQGMPVTVEVNGEVNGEEG